MVLSLIGQFIVYSIAAGYFFYALHKEGFSGLGFAYFILFLLFMGGYFVGGGCFFVCLFFVWLVLVLK